MSNLKLLVCTHCGSKFLIQTISTEYQVLKCKCFEYPLIENIAYLKRDRKAKESVKLIKEQKYKKALLSLFDLRRRDLLIIRFVFLTSVFGKCLFEELGFTSLVKLLSMFFLDKKWTWYVLNRERIPSFFYSLFSVSQIAKKSTVCDVGCGYGQLFPYLEKQISEGYLVGLDVWFFNLFMARRFFASKTTILVCCDIENKLPLEDFATDVIHIGDTFHYVKNKKAFLAEIYRVLGEGGVLFVLQTLSKVQRKDKILGIKNAEVKILLKYVGFKTFGCYSNATILAAITSGTKIDITKGDTKQVLNGCFSYSFFAVKKKVNKKYLMSEKLMVRFNATNIEYKQEPWLLNVLNLRTLLGYENYVFVSPHLDDAVFSCGLLLSKLKNLNKKTSVVTVFTRATKPPYSEVAKEFLRKCEYKSASVLFNNRAIEDKKALKLFRVKLSHLNYIDAAFRKDRKGNYLYNSEREEFSGRIKSVDRELIKKIRKEILTSVKGRKNLLLLAPLGIGSHPDHILVRESVKRLSYQKLFWEDFPYNSYREKLENFFGRERKYKRIVEINEGNYQEKDKATRCYVSQVKPIFPRDRIPKIAERYYKLRD